ncbi:transporter associated domain-containing protein [Rhizobium calliandrae]|uniref:Transporter associated domain-containing protein n=1 Tax=Rhizobium calliandrae TaxID=1312182 RepID=A0ABT7KK84_9HYPH|nr:transporter associated domain-containing protein [Rhizobium calliandrae]MDL2407678.1 transporter associated domain-containing protein [Rhizobium calliandrae]
MSKLVDADRIDDADRYSTLAGFILWRLRHLPHEGENFTSGNLTFEVIKLAGRNIDKVRIVRMEYPI